jgi:hypothetical protein
VSTARWESAAKVLLPSWTLVYTTLRLHRFGANRSCRPVPACAASSGYAPRACRCPRSTACGPAPSPDAPARCAPVLEGDATHRDATATRIGAPSSQRTIDYGCVVMGRSAILLSLCLVLASPEHRPPVPDVLPGAQYLPAHPSGRSLHDTTQATLTCSLKQPRRCPLKRAGGLDGAQGLDDTNKGLALAKDAIGEGRIGHLLGQVTH